MRPYDQAKHQSIKAAFTRFPNLSDRAVARLTGTCPETVARVRAIHGIVTARRVEADGRRARGRRQTVRYDEERSDDSAAVYRAYRHQQLLYVGTSWVFLKRLATHGRRPWWHEITNVTVSHCAHTLDAAEAERTAIREEQPKYNRAGKGKTKLATARAVGAVRSGTATSSRRPVTAQAAARDPNLIRRPTGRVVYKLVTVTE